MNTDPNSITQLAGLLCSPGKKITILAHLNPDGDTLGSSLGLQNLFTKMGHTCQTISPNDYPDFLKWIPGSQSIIVYWHNKNRALEAIKNADIIFSVDFNELKRIREMKEAYENSLAYKVLIDHHPDPQIPADYQLSDVTSSSTAELVFQFIREAGLVQIMDRDVATCLFTGIMTDTGCFSFNSSNQRTWLTVAELLGYGIDKDDIYSKVYDNYSEQRMRLLGYSLNEKMQVFPEFKTGILVLSKDDLTRFDFQVGDSEGFVNYPLSIKGICVSALFTEKEYQIRISFRSKGKFAVNEIAKKHFSGGGHINAAGGESYQSLADTVKLFLDVLPLYKDEINKDD
jgi:phosphoesterase RecJ-like protein